MKLLVGIIKLCSGLVYIIIVLALAIATPILFGYKPVIILSGSMEPDYPVGGITYYAETDFEDIAVGDVITFTLGTSSLATHRVVEIDEELQTFTTKGDSNETVDTNPVAYTDVQGKAEALAIPYAGYFVVYLQNWYVILPLAVVLLLNIILGDKNNAS